MRNGIKREKAPLSARLLNIVIVIMLIVAAGSLTWMITQVRHYSSRERYSMISYYAQDGDYGEMVRYCFNNGYDVEPFETENEAAYQVALYADAAFQQLYFDSVGDESMSARCEEKKTDARARSGQMEPITGEIDRILAEIELHP